MTDAQLTGAINAFAGWQHDAALPEIQIQDADGQHAALMRLDAAVRIQIDGSLGDYAFAYNAEADIRQTGNDGHVVSEGLRSGAVRIRGNAGVGAASAMTGGTVAI
ncbi:MAG: tributyrin esterase, partial [Novipirellula sp. JB048]